MGREILINAPDPDCPHCQAIAANPDAERTLSQWGQHRQWHKENEVRELEKLWEKS